MNNYSNMSFDQMTKKSLFGYKKWVRAALAISMLADLATFIYLLIFADSFTYALIPLLLLVLSGVAIGLSFVIDYRYSYSIWIAVLYSILQAVGVISLIYLTGFNVDVTMSTASYIFYVVTHIVTVVLYNVVAYNTNKLDKKCNKVGVILLAIITIISIASIAYTCVFGFFGQNIGLFDNEMVLVYEKNEDGTYGVKDILYGRGETVVIPESFDGKEITSLSAELFTKGAIKKIVVANSKSLRVDDLEVLTDDLDRLPQIQVNLELMDYYRDTLFNASIQQNSKSALALCNGITYISCPDNKVVVSFNYDFDNLPQMAEGKLFPTIILNKGSTFDLESYIDDVSYISFVNADTEEKIYDAYYQGKGYYLKAPVLGEGQLLDGAVIQSSIEVLPLSFGRVFLIDVTSGNDTKYQVPTELSTTIKDADKGKLIRDDQISTYVASVESLVKREGFDVEYKVGENNLTADILLSDLQDKNSTVIVPNWTIHTPVITGIEGNTNYTYGDELLSLTVNAESVHNLKYQLVERDNLVASDNVFTKSRPIPSDSATYIFKAYIDDEKTSLTAETTKEVVVTVIKKKVEAIWTIPENAVYNENPYTAYATIPSGDMVFEDSSSAVTNIFDGTGKKVINPTNAGTYRMEVAFADQDLDSLYTIIHSTEELEIARCRVDAQWSNTSLIYTGKQNLPSALVNGVSGVLSTKVIGESKDAGEYTAYVEFVNDIDKLNYTISNIFQEYTISAKVINAVWGNSTLVYNDKDQAPVITGFESNSLCEDDILDLRKIEYNGKQKNVGTSYTVTITENFKNYDISSSTSSCEFQITKAPLTIRVENKEVDYDGGKFDDSFNVTAEGLLGNDTLSSVISQLYYGDEVASAQNADTYQIVLSAKQQGVDYNNYTVTYEEGKALKINRVKAIVSWGSETLEYTSQAQHPSVSVKGVNQASLEFNLTGMQTNAGTGYKAEISLVDSLDKQNYYIEINDASLQYVINKKPLTLTAESKSKIYDSKVFTGFTYTYSELGVNDTIDQIVTSVEYNTEATSAIDVGDYDIELTINRNLEKSNNYDITLTKGKLVISKATASVFAEGNSFIFDGTKKLPTIKVTGVTLDGGLAESVSFNAYTRQNGQRQDAINTGAYDVELVLTNNNYKLPTYSISFEITPSQASVEWGNTSLTFTGEKQLPTVTVKGVGGVLVDFTAVTSDGQDSINASDYEAKIILNDANYVLASYTQPFTIKPYTAKIAWLNKEMVYNGEKQLPIAVIKGVNDTVIYSYTVNTVDGLDAVDVGDYEAKVILSDSNYVLEDYTTDFKITQATISPVFKNVTLTYNGNAQLPSFVFTGVKGETIEYSVSTNNGLDAIDVGEYKAIVTLNNSNYKLENNEIGFKIEMAKLTVKWENTTHTYNGVEFAPSVTLKGVDDTIIEADVSGAETNVGTGYTATVSIKNPEDQKNYYIDETDEIKGFSITPAQASVAWDFNPQYTYNGTAQKPTATVTGVSGTLLDATVEYMLQDKSATTESINVGNYVAVLTVNDTNYTLKDSDKELTYAIKKKDLTIKAKDLTVDYTGEDFNEALSYECEGLVDGEDLSDIVKVTISGDAIDKTEVGTYTIEPSIEIINDQNYDIKLVNGTLTIQEVVSDPDQEQEGENE